MNITPPAGTTQDMDGLSVGSGNLSIEVDGQLVKQVQTEVRRDGGAGVSTQFIPIYYIQQILSILSFYNAWDGTTWSGQPVQASMTGNLAVREGTMDVFSLNLMDKNDHALLANGSVTWSVGGNGQASIDKNTGIFTASAPSTYEVTATVDGFHMTKQVQVYGAPAGVTLSASASSVMADGSASKTIAVKAVDAQGNVVQDFMGQVTLTIPSVGGTFSGGTTSVSDSQVVIPLYKGVGTATLTAPSWNPAVTESVTSSALMSSSDVLPVNPFYGSVKVSYTTPVASSIQIVPDTANIVANTSNFANLDVSLIDAVGNPVGSNVASPVNATFNVAGPASFASGQTMTTLSEYVYPGSDTTIPVYTAQGLQGGTVTVTASGEGVTGSATFSNNMTGAVRSMDTSQTTGTLSSAFTVDSWGASGNVTLPAGTQYTLYTVQVVDGNGNPVPEAHTLWISDSTFASGTGRDALAYYSVLGSQPYTKLGTVTTGTYSVTTSAATGRAQFIVFNTGNAPATATINIKDNTTGTAATTSWGN